MPLDLTIATGTFHPEIGGPPRYLHRLAGELRAAGHEVRVLTFAEFEGPHDGDPCPVLRISRRSRVPVRLARMAAAILARARRSDLLYVNDHGLAPAFANLLLRRPVAMKIVGDFAWEYSVRHGLTELGVDEFQVRRPHPKSRLVHRLQRFYAGRADRIVVPSEYLAGIVAGWGVDPGRIVVVPNAVERSGYTIPGTRPEAKRRLGLEFPFLLTIARLTPWKGIDRLIELLPEIPPDVRLVVVGEGPERANLEARAREMGVAPRTIFSGRVAPAEVGIYLKAADVFALYTGYEGLSHVLLEALLAGVPIVASAKGGNPEVIRHGVDGILVPHPDPRELRAAVLRLFSDPAERERLAAAALARSEDFAWPRLLESTIEVFQETIAEHARRRS